jgi:hypothetical protein
MSRAIVLLVSLTACGSPAKSAPTTTPTNTVETSPPAPPPEAPAPAKPAEPPPPPAPAPKPAFHDRLRDVDGPVPGFAGYSLKRTPSTSHCGGTKVTLTRPRTVAPADKHLATLYAIEFPSGLVFDPDPAKKAVREASLKKLDNFVKAVTKAGGDAAKFYGDKVKDKDESVKLAAIARVAQIQFHVASVLARAEIPVDVRTGEFKDDKIAAFCDQMKMMSEPLVAQAEMALETCATAVKQATAKGWWNEVCGG